MNEACQFARQYGTIFNDEFLQACFREGFYTPAQLLWDLLASVYAIGAVIVIVASYCSMFFGKKRH